MHGSRPFGGMALAFGVGALMGFLAKYADGVPVLGSIGSALGIWILMATLIAAWSRSPEAAVLHVFTFFAAMLGAYYVYSAVLFAFFPTYYFLAWGRVALLATLAAYFAWYARGRGWFAALCASAPMALLLAEGRSFHYTFHPAAGVSLFSAVLLFLILPREGRQRLRTIPIVLILFLGIDRLPWVYALFGGL